MRFNSIFALLRSEALCLLFLAKSKNIDEKLNARRGMTEGSWQGCFLRKVIQLAAQKVAVSSPAGPCLCCAAPRRDTDG